MAQPRHQDTRLILAVYTAVLLLSLLLSFLAGNPSVPAAASITIDNEAFTPSIAFRSMLRTDPDLIVYEARVGKADLARVSASATDQEGIGILISRFASNGYVVRWNGLQIGQLGTMALPGANIWNSCAFFPIPEPLLAEENVLRIESRTINKTGVADEPVRIVTGRDGLRFVSLFGFYNHTVLLVGIGILMTSVMFLLLMAILSEANRLLYFLLAAGTLSIGIYAVDYTPFLSLPVSYDCYKRVILVCLGSTGLFYGLSIRCQLRFRPAAWFGAAGFLAILLAALLAPDLVSFRQIYSWWYPTQLINILVWFIASLRVFRRRVEARIYLLGFAVLGIHSAVNFAIDRTGLFFQMNTPLVYVSVLSIIPLMLIYFDFLTRKRQLAHVSEQREAAVTLAHRDTLTDAYNKRYFLKISQEFAPPYSLAVFDLDDFKGVNDRYGHPAGDHVLKHLVIQLQELMRREDILCRVGGDEFAIFLPATADKALSRLETCRERLAERPPIYDGQAIQVTLSMGVTYVQKGEDFNACLRRADQAMYEAKRLGKNRIVAMPEPPSIKP